ncbi:molybdenum transport system permease protein ModB [Abditibacteriota bacterium]|nr:molybdenum transport system permease protein ModB [Abditibacteriota bacterium]
MPGFDPQPLVLSLKVALGALCLVLVAGVVVARAMSGRHFWGKDLLDGLLLLPLVLPPVVTGFLLLVLLGKRGLVGAFLRRTFEWEIIFTPAAAVLASSVVAFPLMYGSMKAAFQSLDPQLEDAARCLGAAPLRVFLTITLPLALPGLVAGTLLSFARALGEFGATIMVAGNIPGQTTTVPTAIYFAAEGGDLKLAGLYAALIGGVNLALVVLVNRLARRTRQKQGYKTAL